MSIARLSDIPDVPHWVIMTSQTTHVPGDERSRRCPGHGYPAHEVNSFRYEFFYNEDDWIDEIDQNERSSHPREIVAFKSSGRAKITKKIAVSINYEEGDD